MRRGYRQGGSRAALICPDHRCPGAAL